MLLHTTFVSDGTGTVISSCSSSRLHVFQDSVKENPVIVTVDCCSLNYWQKNETSKANSGRPSVLCAAYNDKTGLLVFCDSLKNLVLYDVHKNIILQSIMMARKCFKVVISSDAQYVATADKSGDIYLYDKLKNELLTDPILGHISMLLDMILTPDGQFIITCDRDEKIRVSHFPNAYNIESYCLGHTEFVSDLKLLPNRWDILLSSSGDGTIKLWKYLEGKIELNINCFNKDETGSNSVAPLIACDALENNGYFICAVAKLPATSTIFGYQVTLKDMISNLVWVMPISSNFQSMLLKESKVWVLSGDDPHLKLLEVTNGVEVKNNLSKTILQTLEGSKILEGLPVYDLSSYYKTWYDNVEVYYQNKLMRTASKTESISKKVKV